MIFSRNTTFSVGYLCLISIPFLATYALDMQEKTWYATALVVINTVAMMVFYLQFPQIGRLRSIPLFANINWSMTLHKKVGKLLGLIFLLHPILILAPRFMMSYDDGMNSLMSTIKAPQMLTGLIAWVVLIVWILLAVFRKQLNIRYETWRLTHMLGFVTIVILATLHITSVGSHGQYANWFNWMWWGLCGLSLAVVFYNYCIKPFILKSQPFKLVEVAPVSTRDWQVTIEKPENSKFHFEPGQFVWLNTDSYGGVKDHPFSIASANSSLPRVSFIIRSLGDYTSRLADLTIGQKVYVDGPYGSISLEDTNKAKAIVLIAGGAGIGPMLSLVRGLKERGDARPIRLIYANKRMDQMVLQDEITKLESQIIDFKQLLVCKDNEGNKDVFTGVVDITVLTQAMQSLPGKDWAVYLCGPEPMIKAVTKALRKLGVRRKNVFFEQLSF